MLTNRVTLTSRLMYSRFVLSIHESCKGYLGFSAGLMVCHALCAVLFE